ncbi:MAG TPA: ThuA domain-containing protein, partial [Lacipirellulaceae bacterium]|nr:ThuA domain-containing protein [Lacipirellulaceae bacterium]
MLMLAARIASTLVVCCFTTDALALAVGSQLDAAREKYRAGDFSAALKHLEPLLEADGVDQTMKVEARKLAARALHLRGEKHFRQARITESIADFDRELELEPGRAPQHWQRGIALYYAGEYEKGARQFKLHQTVNPQDVENAAWHFLCTARAPGGSVEAARKILIPVTQDPRVPMAQVQQMYAGETAPDEVLRVGEEAGGTAQFYAELYVGLYYEALGRHDESLHLVSSAAENAAAQDNYMGDVARVHVALRQNAATSTQPRNDTAGNDRKRKVLFLAGAPSHGYGAHDHWAGCKLLAKSLNDSGLAIEAEVHRYGWPEDSKIFGGVDCIVIYADGGGGHIVNRHLDEMDALTKKGVGLVCLHYAVEVPKGRVGEKFLEWIGGYFETDWSVNPHWTAKYSKLPDHPITRGVAPFEINDEWYYHMRFRKGMQGVTPILTDLPPADSLARPDGSHSGNPQVRAAIARGEPQHMAWAVEREDGGRGFGFTGGHVHWNWADPNFRKLVLNAIAWCAKVEVPPHGVSDQPKTLVD